MNALLYGAWLLALSGSNLPEEEAAARFGAREAVEDASISPDGMQLAYLAPLKGQGSALYVAPLDGRGEPKPIFIADGKPGRLAGCKWTAIARLLCTIYGVTVVAGDEITYFSRLVALDADGKNVKLIEERGNSDRKLGYSLYGGSVIDWLPDENGSVLMTRQYVPEASTGTLVARTRSGVGVVKLDTRTLNASAVESPRDSASEFITDGRGTVRIRGSLPEAGGSGRLSGETRYFYRRKGSRDWAPLSVVTEEGGGFNPYGVDSELDAAYGLKKLNGRYAAYRVALDGSLAETLIYAHPDVDVDGFVRIGRRRRIVGVTFATDKREARYFDAELDKLSRSLSKAIPNLPLIRFVDSSVDENKLLIWAGSDSDPGRYFLFDRTAGRLTPLMDVRPTLSTAKLASVKPVTYKATDGTAVPAYLTLPAGREDAKGLPAIVMPHGGPGARDEWGFDWLSQYFASLGYVVLQPNFRGSAGYGDSWFQKNGFQNWRTAIGDIDDAARWLTAQGIADPNELAIVGWSYGGYAALQSAVVEPGLFKAVVAIAPVTDLNMLKQDRRDWADYAVVSRFVGSGPHIEQGSPAQNAQKIKVPVLMFHGNMDSNVRISHAKVMQSRLKSVGAQSELVEFPGLDHYLEDASARREMLDRTRRFLATALAR